MACQLTPKHAKLWLPVVRELREYYEGKNDKFENSCPFCKKAEKLCDSYLYENCGFDDKDLKIMAEKGLKWSSCFCCPWFIFEGDSCLVCGENVLDLREERDPIWCKQSIKRLKRWERKLEEIIRRRK